MKREIVKRRFKVQGAGRGVLQPNKKNLRARGGFSGGRLKPKSPSTRFDPTDLFFMFPVV